MANEFQKKYGCTTDLNGIKKPPVTEETRKKLSIAASSYWKRRRELVA
jgi:hypothetical protein